MAASETAMTGRVCLVTGANSGIGKATALGLAEQGAIVVMVCRDQQRGEAARAEIKAATSNKDVDLLLADLSSQRAIHSLADEVKGTYPRLHVLVNNAGRIFGRRVLTADGLEQTFAVNHLAPFLLTNLLLDTLKASAPARIVTVSSGAHLMGGIDFDNLQGERQYRPQRAYSQSKLANILFTYELAYRLSGSNVTATCVHPGLVRTDFAREAAWWYRAGVALMGPFMRSPRHGAETVLYLATSPEVEGVSGKYFDNMKEAPSSPASHDEVVAQRLWEVSAQLTHLSFDSATPPPPLL